VTRRASCEKCDLPAAHVLYVHSKTFASYTRTLLCAFHWSLGGHK
jgi:hypothetical protein